MVLNDMANSTDPMRSLQSGVEIYREGQQMVRSNLVPAPLVLEPYLRPSALPTIVHVSLKVAPAPPPMFRPRAIRPQPPMLQANMDEPVPQPLMNRSVGPTTSEPALERTADDDEDPCSSTAPLSNVTPVHDQSMNTEEARSNPAEKTWNRPDMRQATDRLMMMNEELRRLSEELSTLTQQLGAQHLANSNALMPDLSRLRQQSGG